MVDLVIREYILKKIMYNKYHYKKHLYILYFIKNTKLYIRKPMFIKHFFKI